MSRNSTPRSTASPTAPYGLMSGSPGSALKRGRAKLSRASSASGDAGVAAAPADAPASVLLGDDDEPEPTVVSRKVFDELRSDTLEETISEAGSDDDEVLLLEDEELRQQQLQAMQEASGSGRPVGQVDKLTLLRADSPINKLRFKEREARKTSDAWGRLRLRQDILGLAMLYSSSGPYRHLNEFPMLLSESHFQLAKAYGDLQCVTQAADHCKRALETLPTYGEVHQQRLAFEQEVHIMQAEMLLVASPPKPQAALQYIFTATKTTSANDIENVGIKVLAVQCFSLMGTSKLQEAAATRNALEALRQRVESLTEKLGELDRRSAEHDRVLQRIRDTKNELAEEEGFERVLVSEARDHFDAAVEALMGVIHDEEARIKIKMPGDSWKTHPLIQSLWRLSCEIMFKLSLVEGMAGEIKAQLIALVEMLTAHEVHQCMPDSLLARTYKEKGAVLAAKAAGQKDEKDREAGLKEALDCYNLLLELQGHRYPDNPGKQALLRAETCKLMGNVLVGLRRWFRAKEFFEEAKDIFATYLGPDSNLVLDLEHRLAEVQSYADGADE